MTLEILISQYLENEEVIKPLLDSIAIQQGVNLNDINVIIANDGTNTILDDTFLNQYPFHIDYYLKDHEGLSGTRNFLLDRSNADYLMWCDADDMFLYNNSLNLIFNEIKKGEFDLFVSDFTVEQKDEEGNSYYTVMSNEPHVHGKIVRRQFLLDNNIRWKDELPTHDCRYFFALCQNTTTPDRIKYCKQPFYLWKYNENSTVRKTDSWFLKTYSYFTLSMAYLTEEMLTRGKLQAAASSAFSYIYLTYFLYSTEDWTKEENQEYVERALQDCKTFYNKYSSLANVLDENAKKAIIQKQRNAAALRQKTPYLETITFPDFIKKIQTIPIK